jgi:uncharacterized protein (TIGR02444 family)
LHWPANPFWDYALELYRKEGVEAACLELQQRHSVDVNIVLLCCWLGHRGIVADEAILARISEVVEVWQDEVVRPLRAVRSRLKAALTMPQPGSVAARWRELAGALRQRVLALEIDGERLEQLLLTEFTAGLGPAAAPGVALASANLAGYGRFGPPDRAGLATLLQAAFPDVSASEVAASLGWLERRSVGGRPLPQV